MEVAAEVEELTRTLAHSTRAVPVPADSYRLLGELRATVDHLEQVSRQLSTWHEAAAEEPRFDASAEVHGARANATAAAEELAGAAVALETASAAISRAHSANGAVVWAVPEERA